MTQTYDYLDEPAHLANYLLPAAKESRAVRFFVEGIHCSRCVHRIEGLAEVIPGVRAIRVDIGRSTTDIELTGEGSFARAAKALEEAGYPPHPVRAASELQLLETQQTRRLLMRLGVAGAAAGNIMLLAISVYAGATGWERWFFDWLSFGLFLPVLLFCAQPFFFNSWQNLKQGRASIDLPIAVALGVGSALSLHHLLRGHGDVYFDSLAMLVFLLLAARYLLRRIQLHYLSPSYLQPFFTAHHTLVKNKVSGTFEKRAVQTIQVGDVLRIETGQRVPADGYLLAAEARVNTALLTGEAYPRRIGRGDLCFAGYEAVGDAFEMEVTTTNEESRVGKLLRQIEAEIQRKTPLVSITDKVAQGFTVGVLLTGVLFLLAYWSINPEEAIRRSLALTLLACPCALAFATPLAQSLGLIRAARRGYLIKNAETLEKLAAIKTVALDKTGTLTTGDFRFQYWEGAEPTEKEKAIIGALERRSRHPVAVALIRHLAHRPLELRPLTVDDRVETPGIGVAGLYEGDRYELRRAPSTFDRADGFTRVGFYRNDNLVTVATLGDQLRDEAKIAVADMQRQGLKVKVLSGDHNGTVKAIAQRLGLQPEQALGELSPEEKHQWIKSHPETLMVGDGANDSLALASASVSAAIHGSMESSLHAADIYLAQGGVLGAAHLTRIGRESLKVVYRNLGLSLVYNLIGGTLALFGFVNPLVAAVLMPISSVVSVLSSLWGTRFLRRLGSQR